MGFLSVRRLRKAPLPLNIPECKITSPPHYKMTLLDQFSQEVGSASSASGWVIPDVIYRRVEEQGFSPSALQSPRYNIDSFDASDSSLRGAEMDSFDDCDPNSSAALQTYQEWINQDYQDELFSLTEAHRENIQQVSVPMELRNAPDSSSQSPRQMNTQYNATVQPYPQVSRAPPSVDDSDDDEEVDEFSRNYEYPSGENFIIGPDTDSENGSDTESDSDSSPGFDDEIELGVDSDLADISGTRSMYYKSKFQESYGLDDQQGLLSSWFCHSDSVLRGDEEVSDKSDFGQLHFRNGFATSYGSPNWPIGGSMDSLEYNADFGNSQNMWSSNRAILQGLDLPDYEDFENRSHFWDPDALNKVSSFEPSTNLLSVCDQWNTSMDTGSLEFPFSDSFIVQRGPASANSIYEDALEEPVCSPVEPDLFSPTSTYNDEAHHQYDLVQHEQYPFSPSSPAGHNPFSSDFAWPFRPSNIHMRLQCPLEFNHSGVNKHGPVCSSEVIPLPRIASAHGGLPDPAPPIPGWATFGCEAPCIVFICFDTAQRPIFGVWSGGSFRHTFTFPLDGACAPHDALGHGIWYWRPLGFTCGEPCFPHQAYFCRHGMRCGNHSGGTSLCASARIFLETSALG